VTFFYLPIVLLSMDNIFRKQLCPNALYLHTDFIYQNLLGIFFCLIYRKNPYV